MNRDPALTALVVIAFIIIGIAAAPVFGVLGWFLYSILNM